ncbi:hypothetical protein HOLleu_13756 [Holothuria leucospilota]|uniref:Uncharacterized protein n=1 Tax=Holothuria leucospilota TaxID=206669 RepID=A0A9Q1HBY9_HOLLE|nr:hypothetical protein HOLleu_13756 [Holothuria leucospilota]
MEFNKYTLLLIICLPSLIFRTTNGRQQKTLPDLNRFRIESVFARFVVARDALEEVLQNRKQEDDFCGQDVKLQLPPSVPHSVYNSSWKGEIFLFQGTITDHTLANELTSYLKEQIATTHRFLSVGFPVVMGEDERHGLLYLRILTDSKKKIIHPYSTSIREVTHLDSMEEEEDGTVTIRIGDDVMAYTTQDEVNCQGKKNVGKDFDKLHGKIVTLTSYPLPFDWGCDVMGSQISFCQALEEVKCELAAVEGDVCLRLSTSSSERLPASMKVTNMTGIFRDMFPYLAETVPTESFEAELTDREHATGITFPYANLQLPQYLPHAAYNISRQGEALLAYGNIIDDGLAGDLSNDLKGQVATSYRYFDVNIPVVIRNGTHGFLSVHVFTDSTKKVMYPYHTTINDVTQVDSIEETDDGTVTIRLGDDLMVLNVQRNVNCDSYGNSKIGKVFDKVIGHVITSASYPFKFDWGCELLGCQGFCEVLNEVRCELEAVGGDVCALISTYSSKRCSTTFAVVEMAGIFQKMLPFVYETVPSESFEAESIEREHTAALIGYRQITSVGKFVLMVLDLYYLPLPGEALTSTKKVLCPYHTTVNDVTQVDSIEETDDGTVTIRLGDDVMVFRVQRDVKCDFKEKEKIGKVFDQVVGKIIPTTSYPSRFDWGCQFLGSDVSFCKVLHKVGCELAAVEGDVCTLTSTTSSKRCLATFTFVEMTGIFQELLSLLAEIVPSESFESESIKRDHTTGIIYPCLTPRPT